MLIVFAVLCWAASLYLISGLQLRRKAALSLFSLALLTYISLVGFGAISYFTDEGINQAAIFHIRYGLKGAGFFQFKELIIASGLALLLGTYVTARAAFHPVTDWTQTNTAGLRSSAALLILALVLNPLVFGLVNSIWESWRAEYNQAEKIRNSLTYYVPPSIENTDRKTSNLVFIYLEGLERTYLNQDVFPGLTPNLNALEATALSFTNVKQLLGTSWTIAGLVASQCGMPLVMPGHGNSMSGMDRFLGAATCFGDLLEAKGYNLQFMGGADLNFAGKGKFLRSHGFSSVEGRRDLLPRLPDPDYRTWWGLYDDSLLNLAYQKYTDLSRGESPFGLFLLTLDTHPPDGHPSKSCDGLLYGDGTNPVLNSVHCSDVLVSQFVEKIMMSPAAKRTLIVIASDHLSMRNSAYDQLQSVSNERRNLFLIIDPSTSGARQIAVLGSTLDIASTVIPAMGFVGEVGFGRNLLDDSDETSAEVEFIHDQLPTWMDSLGLFWGFPTVEHGFTISPQEREMVVDGRSFGIPALVQFDSNLGTKMLFDFDRHPSHLSIQQHVAALPDNSAYLLVDYCGNFESLINADVNNGFCLALGMVQDKIERRIERVSEPRFISKEELVEAFRVK